MTYEMYRMIFQIAGGLSIGLLVVSVILFFVLKIPRVIGDLSGRTARKAIEDIRKQNTQSGDKRHKTSAVNRERGMITDRITPSGNLMMNRGPVNTGVVTEKIGVVDDSGVSLYQSGTEETMPLTQNETGATEVLANETEVLANETEVLGTNDFSIEFEICLIHSDVKIE